MFATKTQISNRILKPKFVSSVCTLLQPNSTWPAWNTLNHLITKLQTEIELVTAAIDSSLCEQSDLYFSFITKIIRYYSDSQ